MVILVLIVKAAKSVTFDLKFLEIMILISRIQ